MVTQVAMNLCRSCGQGFEARIPSLIICKLCVIRRAQTNQRLVEVNPISAAAKSLAVGIEAALLARKFILAESLCQELVLLVKSDQIEARNRKMRDQAKKERWTNRQGERRVNDQTIRSRMKGNK